MVSIDTIVPNLIVGIGLLCVGIAIVWKRRALNEYMYNSQKRMFGEKAARVSAGRQTPFMMGIVGVLTAILGVAMFTFGMVGIMQMVSA
ncbi:MULTISPECIES: hypothetical protein [unclassified Microbacterium]|uniref:hypothetical protein n=1 Tax=unclassified Microbacterium TaxID=2609290 RepID=UPI0034653E9B